MDCKKVQEIIITDYIDAQIEEKSKILIDQHLFQCAGCRGFLANLKREVITPLTYSTQPVPSVLWSQIRGAIADKEQKQIQKALAPGFWERLKAAMYIPKPALILATAFTMIFIMGTTTQFFVPNKIVSINGQQQVEYLSSLMDDPLPANSGSTDLQTPIEKYFL